MTRDKTGNNYQLQNMKPSHVTLRKENIGDLPKNALPRKLSYVQKKALPSKLSSCSTNNSDIFLKVRK